MIPARQSLIPLTLILLAAVGLQSCGISDQSIWFDEGWSAYAAVQPSLFDAARADLTNPPLYYVLLNAAARFFGDSELALRWVSLLLALLTLALTYRFTRRLFGVESALYAAALLAVSALLWWGAREARMYTLLALLVVIAAANWHRLLREPRWYHWLGVWLAQMALLYSHNTGPIAAVWLNAVTILAWLSGRSLRRPDWRLWLAGQVGIFFVWLPWWQYFRQLTEANSAVTSAPQLSPQFLFDVWQGYTLGVWPMVNSDRLLSGLALLLLVIALLIIPWRQASARWLVIHAGLLTGGIVAGLIVLQNEFHGRYLTMISPLVFAVIGAGLPRLKAPLRFLLMMPFIGLFLWVFAASRDPQFQHDDAQAMVQYYADTLDESATVIAWSYADRYDLRYYWDRLNVRANRLTLPEGADLEAILPLLPREGPVSINVWYTQRGDYRGMLHCLVASGTAQEPRSFTVAGMTDLRFDDPSIEEPRFRDVRLTFGQSGTAVAEVVRHGLIPQQTADRALCLPVDVNLFDPTDVPLKAALIVRNRLGWEIARADAVIASANQRTTDSAAVGEIMSAYPLVRLPYGAPADDYPIYLRLYTDAMLSGFEPQQRDAVTSGRDILLGTWTAPPGGDWASTNRTTTLPYAANHTVDSGVSLVAHDIEPQPAPVQNGERLRMTLLWTGRGFLPSLRLRDGQGAWTVDVPTQVISEDTVTLDWREVRVPLEAERGTAVLELPDGTILAEYPVEPLPALLDPPEMSELNSEIPDVGTLTGYILPETVAEIGRPFEVTLVWQGGAIASQTDYVVFVQLLNDANELIAQSDSQPAAASRPTSGWRDGEYILDTHQLIFNANAAPGPASLIVGLYDPLSNQRVRVGQQTFLTIPAMIDVR